MKELIPLFLGLLLAACNMPAPGGDDSNINNQAGTIVAMTLNAQRTPTRENTPQPTATLAMTSTVTLTITPTYSVPMLTVNEPTNCRTGPGQSFDVIFTFLAGAQVEVVGSYPTNNYWVVRVEGMDQPCWVWGEYVTTTGSIWTLPSVTPPPTEAPQPAGQPTNLNYTYNCTYNGVDTDIAVTLTWTDQASDELAYRIFRDSKQVAELPANSTTYTEITTTDATQTITYSVSAYNAAGESGRATISFSCQ